jgi:hypothetical protein
VKLAVWHETRVLPTAGRTIPEKGGASELGKAL